MKNGRYQISYIHKQPKNVMVETRKMKKKKTEIFEFVEVENMIKVHDEINFFQYS